MRRFLALALVLAACGSAASEVTEPPESTLPATTDPATSAPAATTAPATSAPSTAGGALDAELLAEALSLQDDLSDVTVALFATKLGETGDDRWVPYLIDLMRLAGGGESLGRINGSLAALTGIPVPEPPTDGLRVYGSWMYEAAVDPGPEYVGWKADLYGLIDGEFTELLAQVDDPVLASRLQWGGVVRGGIPELDHQDTSSVDGAPHMTPDELTFGAVVNGEARAYPHRVLDHHELANDTLGGEPVALVNCTLCRTGILYSRLVDGRLVEFETSGLLLNSNKVMVDRQTNTLWEQLTGIAIAGELQGTELDRHFITVTTWADWVAEHPDTDVLTIPGFPGYSYEPGDAYAAYYAAGDVWFPTFDVPDVFADHEEMGTVVLDGVPFAVSVAALGEAGSQAIAVGERAVAAVPTGGGVRFYDITGAPGVDLTDAVAGEEALAAGGDDHPRLQSGHSFWFAWYGDYPDTGWWPTS
jgi:hypothetical protein